MNIRINNNLFSVGDDMTGQILLSLLPSIAGECFRGYWLENIKPDGNYAAVKSDDIIQDGECFWAIPPCHM